MTNPARPTDEDLAAIIKPIWLEVKPTREAQTIRSELGVEFDDPRWKTWMADFIPDYVWDLVDIAAQRGINLRIKQAKEDQIEIDKLHKRLGEKGTISGWLIRRGHEAYTRCLNGQDISSEEFSLIERTMTPCELINQARIMIDKREREATAPLIAELADTVSCLKYERSMYPKLLREARAAAIEEAGKWIALSSPWLATALKQDLGGLAPERRHGERRQDRQAVRMERRKHERRQASPAAEEKHLTPSELLREARAAVIEEAGKWLALSSPWLATALKPALANPVPQEASNPEGYPAQSDGTTAYTQHATPEDAGWIEWHGGECPIQRGVGFEFKTKGDPNYVRGIFYDAPQWEWGDNTDIIAYRVLP